MGFGENTKQKEKLRELQKQANHASSLLTTTGLKINYLESYSKYLREAKAHFRELAKEADHLLALEEELLEQKIFEVEGVEIRARTREEAEWKYEVHK